MTSLSERAAAELPEIEAGEAAPASKPGRSRSLTRQLRYGLPLFVLISLLLTSGLLIGLSFDAQRQQLVELQGERSRAAAVEIEAYLDDLQRKLGYLSRVRGLAGQPPELQLRLLEALTRHNDAYELVAIADARGQVSAAVAPYGAAAPQDVAGEPVFARAYGQGDDFIGPVEVDAASGLPLATFGVPVRDEDDRIAGVLIARVSLKFLSLIVAQTSVGETGYGYVLDNRGRVIADPGDPAGSYELTDIAERPYVRALLTTPIVGQTYTGLDGAEVLGSSTRVRGVNWHVVAELPTAEAYAPLRRSLLVLSAVLGAALLLAVAAGFAFARRVVAPLQQLTGAAERLSAGDLGVRVAAGAHNELGLLGHTFNAMAERLGAVIADLSASERRFRAIFDQTFQLTGLLRPDGTVLEANRSALAFGGLAPAEVIGRPFWEAGWWHLDEGVQRQIRGAVERAAAGEFVRFEIEARDAGGAPATLDFSLKPVRDERGRVVLLIPEGRDITDRRAKEQAERRLIAERAARAEAEAARQRFAQLAEENERLYHEAQQALRVRNEFLSLASHELKTPLTPLLGQAQLMHRRALREGSLSERDMRAIQVIAGQATRLNRLIEALLDVARLERGQLSLSRAPVDLRDLVQRVVAEVGPTLERHRLGLRCEPAALMVEGDWLRLEQVLLNLIGNAVKYSPAGGPVEVAVARSGASAIVSVADEGIGVAPEAMPRLFERFYRAPNAADGPVSGLGVGLYVVREIVGLHGGTIGVESAEGRGSRFTITLPLAPAPSP